MSTAGYTETFTEDGVELVAEFEVEPAQDGGMIDPSYPAHVYDLAITIDDKLVKPEDVDEDGFDYTELYKEIEKKLNLNMASR
jgi:hypothetical protein